MPELNRWRDIYKHLKSKGYDVYAPGQKVGDCTSKYIVVKNDGTAKVAGTSSEQEYYSVMCYVPLAEYSELETFKQKVKEDMKELHPMVSAVGEETPSYTDTNNKSHMISVEYRNYKKSF